MVTTVQSATVASILLGGAGLALIAAYLFMAANFERNKDGLDKPFTRLALVAGALSASALVVGTVETIEVKDLAVTIVMLGIVALVILTVVAGLCLARIPRFKVKSQETGRAEAPIGIDEAIKRAPVSELGKGTVEGERQEQVDKQQNGAVDRDVAESLPERSEG